jgi:hypothetical protein
MVFAILVFFLSEDFVVTSKSTHGLNPCGASSIRRGEVQE